MATLARTNSGPGATDREVVLAGAVGGLVAWVIGGRITLLFAAPVWVEAPVAAIVGAVASYLGVFLLATTDTAQRARCISFALACGLAWRPVVEAATSFVGRSVTQNAIAADAKKATDLASGLSQTTGPDKAKISAATASAVDVVKALPEIKDPALTSSTRQQVSQVIAAVQTNAEKSPEAATVGGEALTRLGAAAASANEPTVANEAATSVLNLAKRADSQGAKALLGGLAHVEVIAEAKDPLLAKQLRERRLAAENALVR